MKKILCTLLLLFISSVLISKAETIPFAQAMSQSKPVALLVYADWANNVNTIENVFDGISEKYSKEYVFAKVNMSQEEDAKAFNKSYTMLPNLPYIMLYRNNGKISRLIDNSCSANRSCISSHLDLFIHK